MRRRRFYNCSVKFDQLGFVLIENFAILPAWNGRGIATIFNELILHIMRPSLPTIFNDLHTAVTIPSQSNVYAVQTVGFVRAVIQSKYAKLIAKATGLGYDAGWNAGTKKYSVGAFYIYPLK